MSLKARALAPTIALVVALASAAESAERPIKLDQAIALALERNEGLLIERESLAAAKAYVMAARGAYDPLLELQGGWQKSVRPANSLFSGAPAGQAAPEAEGGDAGASLRQLLPTGGEVSLRASGARQNNTLTIMSAIRMRVKAVSSRRSGDNEVGEREAMTASTSAAASPPRRA